MHPTDAFHNITGQRGLRGRLGRAFTLLELLVVIAIIGLLLAVTAPAVSSIIRSTEEASAKNQLDVAMSAARSAAITSEAGGDTAAVFFYRPGGRVWVGIFRKAGELKDVDMAGNQVVRDVFVPTSQNPFSFPTGWMVRGLAPIGTLHDENGDRSGWYEQTLGNRKFEMTGTGGSAWWNWVYPETHFFNPKERTDDPAKGAQSTSSGACSRQTFMVRFEAGTGQVKTGDRRLALVIDPSPSNSFRTQLPYRLYRFNRGDDVGSVVRQILETREANLSTADKRRLLGDQAVDTVLAQSVTELGLYREADLAAALGAASLNRDSRTLLKMYDDKRQILTYAQYDESTAVWPDGFPGADVIAAKTNDWFVASETDPDVEAAVTPFVYTIDHASGKPVEVR
ncbi:MAG TPA: prepilin-type N-terminal cleavage/methylation domain-containing protein [Phycisphaerales bacterium]|nr:prepilin-type N-terminal cleavage/methylation domain-containing protein [Phycisphaerales bacterium]